MRLLYTLLAAGTALTNSTTETVLGSYEIPANGLQAGKVYQMSGAVLATATNSTDTLRIRVRVGPTTLTGTVVADSGAVDVANGDVVAWSLTATVRNTGSTSVVLVSGFCSAPGAEGTATARVAFESLSIDSAVAQKIEATGVWSVANAGNSCRCDSFVVAEMV
jgi:hypothetical protein